MSSSFNCCFFSYWDINIYFYSIQINSYPHIPHAYLHAIIVVPKVKMMIVHSSKDTFLAGFRLLLVSLVLSPWFHLLLIHSALWWYPPTLILSSFFYFFVFSTFFGLTFVISYILCTYPIIPFLSWHQSFHVWFLFLEKSPMSW